MSNSSLKSMIQKALSDFPNNILLEDNHSTWTGQELEAHLPLIVKRITQQTLFASRVGICFHNSASLGIAILATHLAGRIPVMINSVDLVEGKIDWIRRAKLNFVITSEELANLIKVPHLVLTDKGMEKELVGKTSIMAELDQVLFMPPKGTGVVLFTSGSTGEPKEVYVPEQGILSSLKELKSKFECSEKTVASIILPVCHSMALNTQFYPTFVNGGKSHFYNIRLSMNKVFRNILSDKVTFISMIGEIVRTCWEEKKQRDLPACEQVTHVQLAGGMISQKHLEMTRELFPNAVIYKGYGLTEAIRVTMISSQESQFYSSAVGKPMPFLNIEIRNEKGETLPPGQLGEIFVKGDSVMLGLRSLSSMEMRITEPKLFMATGDIGMIDEAGYLHITGRIDSLFKINGKRVAGAEIEKIALESTPQFRFAKALLMTEEESGRSRIVLFIELDRASWKDGSLSLDIETQQLLSQRMKLLSVPPKEIIFTPHIPRTSNGKLNIPALKRIWSIQSMLQPVEKKIPVNLNLFSVNEVVFS